MLSLYFYGFLFLPPVEFMCVCVFTILFERSIIFLFLLIILRNYIHLNLNLRLLTSLFWIRQRTLTLFQPIPFSSCMVLSGIFILAFVKQVFCYLFIISIINTWCFWILLLYHHTVKLTYFGGRVLWILRHALISVITSLIRIQNAFITPKTPLCCPFIITHSPCLQPLDSNDLSLSI